MKPNKFRYIFKHKASGNIEIKHYYLDQLEERSAKELSPCFSDDYEILSRDQYTGLKDRNFTEVYEGDIIEYSSHDNIRRGRVIWLNQLSRFTYLDKGIPISLEGILKTKGLVMGNAFEIPDWDSY